MWLAASGGVAQASSASLCVRNYFKQWSGAPPPAGIALSDAEELIRLIAKSIGLVGGVTVIECEEATKAQAWSAPADLKDIPAGDYIIFDPIWVRDVLGKDRTQATTILGHELGHLVGRHSTSRAHLKVRERELEADRFAGCAVARTNGDWNRLEDILGRIRHDDNTDENSYPSVSQSLAAAKAGFEDCGGNAALNPRSAFLEYKGPPINETFERLKSRYPSGKWLVDVNTGVRTFSYTTTVLGKPATLKFRTNHSGSGGVVDRVTIFFSNNYMYESGHRLSNTTGKFGEPDAMCKDFLGSLRTELASRIGPVLDRPTIEKEDWSDELNYSAGWCEQGLWNCSKSASAVKSTTSFDSSAKITLRSRFDNWQRSQESKGGGEHFSNSVGTGCRIWVEIEDPAQIK